MLGSLLWNSYLSLAHMDHYVLQNSYLSWWQFGPIFLSSWCWRKPLVPDLIIFLILIKPSALTWVYILEMIETWVQFWVHWIPKHHFKCFEEKFQSQFQFQFHYASLQRSLVVESNLGPGSWKRVFAQCGSSFWSSRRLASSRLRTNPRPGTTRKKVVHNAYGVKCFGLFLGKLMKLKLEILWKLDDMWLDEMQSLNEMENDGSKNQFFIYNSSFQKITS
jgi:hypothetical protein